MANGKATNIPMVVVAVALTACIGTQAWALKTIIEHGKAIAAMQVEQRYSDTERADTKAWRQRIENKIDANAAALAALRGAD